MSSTVEEKVKEVSELDRLSIFLNKRAKGDPALMNTVEDYITQRRMDGNSGYEGLGAHSILDTLSIASKYGLSLNTACQMITLRPDKNKKKLDFWIGFRGYIMLAQKCGVEVQRTVIHVAEMSSYDVIDNRWVRRKVEATEACKQITHTKENVAGILITIHHPSGRAEDRFYPADLLRKMAKAENKTTGAWFEHHTEMLIKTAIKNALKLTVATHCAELARLEFENDADEVGYEPRAIKDVTHTSARPQLSYSSIM